MATVWAHIVKRAQYAIFTAHDQDVFADDLAGDVIIGLGHFASVCHAQPCFVENLFFFVFKHGVAGVIGFG